MKTWLVMALGLGMPVATGIATAGDASVPDAGDRVDRRFDNLSERIDQRLDGRGDRFDRRRH